MSERHTETGRDQREAPCAGEEVRGAFVTEEFLTQISRVLFFKKRF